MERRITLRNAYRAIVRRVVLRARLRGGAQTRELRRPSAALILRGWFSAYRACILQVMFVTITIPPKLFDRGRNVA